MTVLLVGHSFIRRFRDTILRDSPFVGKDILCKNSQAAAIFADKLRINEHFQQVFTISQRLYFIHQLSRIQKQLLEIRPDIVLVDIGSNDLANLTFANPGRCLALATAIFDFAQTIISSTTVIINSVLPRVGRLNCSPKTFLENCTYFNNFLKHLCSSTPNIKYQKLRGFFGSDPEHKLSWSLDGIHCNASAGQRMYTTRLRQTLLSSCHNIKS